MQIRGPETLPQSPETQMDASAAIGTGRWKVPPKMVPFGGIFRKYNRNKIIAVVLVLVSTLCPELKWVILNREEV